MALLYGADFQQPSAAATKPHVLQFATARTASDDTLLEVWNGGTNAARVALIDKDGKFYSNAATAGDLLYAVTGGITEARRFDSLAVGTAEEVLHVNAGGTAPEWTSTLTGLAFVNPALSGSVAGTPTWSSTQAMNVSGNAATATALETARTINGVSFDGTGNIVVTAAAGTLTGATLAAGVTASSLTSVGTLTSLTVSGTIAVDDIVEQTTNAGVTITADFLAVESDSVAVATFRTSLSAGNIYLGNDVWGATKWMALEINSIGLASLYGINAGSGSVSLSVDLDTASVAAGKAGGSLGTTDTDGFFLIPRMAGVPTGTPTAIGSARTALVYDTTNQRFYIYDQVATAWRYASTT